MRLFLRPLYTVFIFVMTLAPLFSLASPVLLGDRSVITVGNFVITHDEFVRERDFFKQLNGVGKQTPQQAAAFDKQFAELLLDMELQIQAASSWHLDLSEEDKKVAISEMLAMNNVSDESALRERLEERGVNVAMFYHQAYKQFFLKKIHGLMLGQRIRLSDAEVTAIYEQKKQELSRYYVEDVVFNTEKKSKSRQQVLSERAHALSGTWKQSKLSAATVPNGAKLVPFKWQTLAELPPQFHQIVGKMAVGDVSQPIQTDNGYHVLKVIKIKAPDSKSLDRDQLRQLLYMQRMTEELPLWIQDLKEQVYTKIDLS